MLLANDADKVGLSVRKMIRYSPLMARPRKTSPTPKQALSYRHPDADLSACPEIGAQAHFKKIKPPTIYRFDSTLAPTLVMKKLEQ